MLPALLGILLSGCSGPSRNTQPPPDRGTALADFDTTSVVVHRASFCDVIDPAAVRRALGSDPAETTSYLNGDRAAITATITDVAHEYSCRYATDDDTVARAWLFAPRIPVSRARALVTGASRAKGCHRLAGAPAFGDPGVGLLCRRQGTTTVTFRGLFVDAWLSCSLSAQGGPLDRADLVDRAGRWCVEVVTASAASTAP